MNECNELTFMVEEAPEGGYTAHALGAAIFTEADNLAQLPTQLRDVVHCHFGADVAPKILRLRVVRDEVIAV